MSASISDTVIVAAGKKEGSLLIGDAETVAKKIMYANEVLGGQSGERVPFLGALACRSVRINAASRFVPACQKNKFKPGLSVSRINFLLCGGKSAAGSDSFRGAINERLKCFVDYWDKTGPDYVVADSAQPRRRSRSSLMRLEHCFDERC